MRGLEKLGEADASLGGEPLVEPKVMPGAAEKAEKSETIFLDPAEGEAEAAPKEDVNEEGGLEEAGCAAA